MPWMAHVRVQLERGVQEYLFDIVIRHLLCQHPREFSTTILALPLSMDSPAALPCCAVGCILPITWASTMLGLLLRAHSVICVMCALLAGSGCW